MVSLVGVAPTIVQIRSLVPYLLGDRDDVEMGTGARVELASTSFGGWGLVRWAIPSWSRWQELHLRRTL
jgi:hypothetical protein